MLEDDGPDDGVELGERGLGERLRAARTRRGMTLREVARRLSISPSLVSQIETGKVQPSVKTLYALTTELGVSLDAMFSLDAAHGQEALGQEVAPPHAVPDEGLAQRGLQESPSPEAVQAESGSGPGPVAVLTASPAPPIRQGVRLQRATEARTLELESGVRWERLGTYDDLAIEIRRTTYQPGSASSTDGTLLRHSGREFGTVIEGVLSITVGFDDYVLRPGDSISFDSTIPHRLRNDGPTSAYAIWVEIGRHAGDATE